MERIEIFDEAFDLVVELLRDGFVEMPGVGRLHPANIERARIDLDEIMFVATFGRLAELFPGVASLVVVRPFKCDPAVFVGDAGDYEAWVDRARHGQSLHVRQVVPYPVTLGDADRRRFRG